MRAYSVNIQVIFLRALIAIAFFQYWLLVLLYGLDFPWLDELKTVAAFMVDYQSVEGVDKIDVVFQHHNSNLLVTSHLIHLLLYYTLGYVDLYWLLMIGAAIHSVVVCQCMLLVDLMKVDKNINLVIKTVVSMLLLVPISWSIMYWSISGVAGPLSVLFPLLAFGYFYREDSESQYYKVFSIFLLLLGVLSNSNGLIAWLSLVIVFPLFEFFLMGRQPKAILGNKAYLSLLTSFVLVMIVHMKYIETAYSFSERLIYQLNHMSSFIQNFFILLGSPFAVERGYVAIMVGLCVLTVLFFNIVLLVTLSLNHRIQKKSKVVLVNIVTASVFFLLILIIIAVIRGRHDVDEVGYLLNGYYSYPATLLVVMQFMMSVVLLSNIVNIKRWAYIVFSIALIFFINQSAYAWPILKKQCAVKKSHLSYLKNSLLEGKREPVGDEYYWLSAMESGLLSGSTEYTDKGGLFIPDALLCRMNR